MQLEEGELSDESDGDINPYIPLERPAIIHNRVTNNLPPDDDDDDDIDDTTKRISKGRSLLSGSSDSDSDSNYVGKKMRMTSSVPKKYSVWTKDPNDILTDVMDKIGMGSPENDRNVENYPIPFIKKWKSHSYDKKRKIPGLSKKDYIDHLHPKSKPKDLEDLVVTDLNSDKEIADDLAQKLAEPNHNLLLRVVMIAGKLKAIDLYEKTREIENEGGMLVLSGTRKRTSGGIYFYLIRLDKEITEAQKTEIFESERTQTSVKRKKRRLREKLTRKLVSEHITLSNPPPSPDPEADLPSLPLRKELVTYDDDMFM